MNYKFSKSQNKVYIIAGKLKGRKISFVNTPDLRPTTNRIRETLFNWLSKHIKNAHCLDCFAGSGVLGIESISRSAASVTSLEINKQTVFSVKKNINKLNISNFKIIHTNTISWLKKNKNPYDIIFIDPPYYKGLTQKIITLLKTKKWIKKNTFIYIENEKKQKLIIPQNWILYKKITTHYTVCHLYILDKKFNHF